MTKISQHSEPVRPGPRGILLPFPTPFTDRGAIDEEALRSNLAAWNSEAVAGYVALGSTGEQVHLDAAERLRVVKVAREQIPEGKRLIVGAGEQSTRATVDEIRRLAEILDGQLDAALVVTPHYYKAAMNTAALLRHYTTVADASPVPVLLYNIPQNTGVQITPEAVEALSRHPNILGLKESSGDYVALSEMLARRSREEFLIFTGHAALLHAALMAGAAGGILAAGCLAPQLPVGLCAAAEAADHATARALQRKLSRLAQRIPLRFGVGGLKYALDLCGYRGGAVRAPLAGPDEAGRAEIRRVLEELELIESDAGRQSAGAGAQ